jgi:hypothetical protein
LNLSEVLVWICLLDIKVLLAFFNLTFDKKAIFDIKTMPDLFRILAHADKIVIELGVGPQFHVNPHVVDV